MAENQSKKAKPAVQAGKTKKIDPALAAKKQAKRASMDAFELVRLRNFFYRDSYRRLIMILLLMSTLLVVMGGWAYYLLNNRPTPRYFATNVQGGITPLHRLNTAGLKTDYILSWAARGATKAFTFNYVQYRDQIETAKNIYFTSQGGTQFLQQLSNSNDLKAVLAGKFIVTAQPAAAPSLIWQGIVPSGVYKGRYGWQDDDC